jgi:hypothetical protein
VSPVLPFHVIAIDQLEIRFVDELRRLKGMIGSLSTQIGCRNTAKLFIDEFEETVAGLGGWRFSDPGLDKALCCL